MDINRLTKCLTSTALLTAALVACSAAPPSENADESAPRGHETASALVSTPPPVISCGPCQVDGEQSCTEVAAFMTRTYTQTCSHLCPNTYPACGLQAITANWTALTSFMNEFGCTQSGYWLNYVGQNDLAANTEAYALCPRTEALEAWVKANPYGIGTMDPPTHEANACDGCLAAAVEGWTYVFFEEEYLRLPRPGCSGTGCLSERW